jgi:toxin-antitoxin system PIN domain toxin
VLLPDVNVLLAAFRPDHPHHDRASAFLEEALLGDEPVGFSVIVLAGVVRLATSARVFVNPDTTDAVCDFVDALLEEPGQLVAEGARHWTRFSALCRELQLRGNLVPDAHLATIAIDQRAEIVTFDRGFARFPQLRWRCLLDG